MTQVEKIQNVNLLFAMKMNMYLVINVLRVRLELITPRVIWQMVQLQPAMLLFAMKIIMYKTINVKNVRVKDTMMLEMMLVVQIHLVKH